MPARYLLTSRGNNPRPKHACARHLGQVLKYKLSPITAVIVECIDRSGVKS
jgi:hypothetical protein